MNNFTKKRLFYHRKKKHDARAHCICSICHDLLEDPITIKSCDHNFCRACIENWTISKYREAAGNILITHPCPGKYSYNAISYKSATIT